MASSYYAKAEPNAKSPYTHNNLHMGAFMIQNPFVILIKKKFNSAKIIMFSDADKITDGFF